MPKPATDVLIRRWLKPRRAERVIDRIGAAEADTVLAEIQRDGWIDWAKEQETATDQIRVILDTLRADPDEPEPPTEPPDEYLPPGLDAPVLRFPITDRPVFVASVSNDHMAVGWHPDLDWPGIFKTLNAEPDWYWGNSGLILHTQYGWRTVSTEWMRKGREEDGTSYPFAEQVEKVGDAAAPTAGMPIGIFVASLWRAGWESKVDRRTWVQWFDPETWKRIEVPDFTVPEQVEKPPELPEPVLPSWREDYDTVNSAAWIAGVEPLPRGRVHLRWAGGRVFHPNIVAYNSRIWLEGDTLMAKYWGNSAWEPKDVGNYANLHFAMMVDEQLLSKVIVILVRPANDREFSIPDIAVRVKSVFGELPERGALCAWWRSSLDDNVRDDFFPWRWGVQV